MRYEVLCQNSVTGVVYDVTDLAGTVTHSTYLSGQPGKLTVTLVDDPTGNLSISCGSILTFRAEDVGIFYGYVFSVGADRTGACKITAYDKMRYLQNKDIYITPEMTASGLFELVCRDHFVDGWEVVTPSRHVAPEYNHEGKTLYQVVQYGIDLSLTNEKKRYFIRDKFGTLQFTEVGAEKSNAVIGDESLLSDYQYNVGVDKETYNRVVVYRDDKETGKRVPWMAHDSRTEAYWGRLQRVEKAPEGYNEAQVREFAAAKLNQYNREVQTLTLNALGVVGMNAGNGFRLAVKKLGVNYDVWVNAAVHTYERDRHVMKLEVAV